MLILHNYNIVRYININRDPLSYFDIKKYHKLPRVNKKGKVVISCTTVPGRIETSKYTIASILNQTVRVDEIRFNIPYRSLKGKEYVIPTWMTALSQHLPLFKIKRCNRDWGPATKIIPAILDSTPSVDSIIYLDDDMIYNKDIIETLISFSNKYPNYAICNQGWDVERWNGKSSLLGRTLHHTLKYIPYVDPYYHVFTDVMQGFSGCLIKPKFFNKKKLVQIDKYPKEVIYVDDVYLSGLLNNQNVKRISTEIPSALPFLHEFIYGFLLRSASNSLSSEHNNDLINDRIACTCFKWVKQVNISLR